MSEKQTISENENTNLQYNTAANLYIIGADPRMIGPHYNIVMEGSEEEIEEYISSQPTLIADFHDNVEDRHWSEQSVYGQGPWDPNVDLGSVRKFNANIRFSELTINKSNWLFGSFSSLQRAKDIERFFDLQSFLQSAGIIKTTEGVHTSVVCSQGSIDGSCTFWAIYWFTFLL